MPYLSLNPTTGECLQAFDNHIASDVPYILEKVAHAQASWSRCSIEERAAIIRRAADQLSTHRERYAGLITLEMGKLLREALDEVDKCAALLRWFADRAPSILTEESVGGDGNVIAYMPVGVVLGIMPWNYPFSQVFRYAGAALVAGNGCVLKHAANVPQCAFAIEALWRDAGLPEHLFRVLLIEPEEVPQVIASPHIHAIALTGSEAAGRSVAAVAGAYLKKTVLELGGSDPFIVLADANLDDVLAQAVTARFTNCGQSCLSAKRFIVVPSIADQFVDGLADRIKQLKMGDPLQQQTTLAPMARAVLRDKLHEQVMTTLAQGGRSRVGCHIEPGEGLYYQASLIDAVPAGSPAYADELFGPVAAVIRAADENDAMRIANDNRFGLGGSIWTSDIGRGKQLARRIHAGYVSVNRPCRSDPQLPLGGVKASGYGREMGEAGLKEFVTIQVLRS
ncbi:succinate-semialdehyde dehydrogenase/glutarate-semialdehyde dehydrogenase [Chitinivorax tropicus]|uniref:Succinate-semialdehyde dehydrogenase/glutarate-semialdehyde dehydrogenase n=1 Tax=Chitinivorax tropicus TaxID=714531 RepID=A0A840ML85_9PROT|nr:NAD-dependent succinate-semialdehyde dehydrogenase [Chitinivorax tropicus]MBB5017472.1 succinate-semialdehyde dehydrogenase/glutarate-semialdehyde dehydrogenase [Chitinivorax tropicus]